MTKTFQGLQIRHKEKWTYEIPRVNDHRLVARVAHHTDANLEQVICSIPVFGVFREFNTFSESFDGLEKHSLVFERDDLIKTNEPFHP